MNSLSEAIGSALLAFLWQGALIAFFAALFRPRSPQARYVFHCGALALAAAMPLVTAWLYWSELAAPVLSVSIPQPFDLPLWAVRVWTVGALLFSARLAWGCREVTKLARTGDPLPAEWIERIDAIARRMRYSQPVYSLVSAIAEVPGIAGFLRPVLLIPAATLARLPVKQLEAVIAHEIAHLRRYDHLVNFAQMVVETLLFYHPAVWWLSSRIREDREMACDDLAVEAMGDAVVYARALTALEKLRAPMPMVTSNGAPLQPRIERLVIPGLDAQSSRIPAVSAAMIGLLLIALNVGWAQAPTPAVPPVPPAPPQVVPAPVAVEAPAPQTVPEADVPLGSIREDLKREFDELMAESGLNHFRLQPRPTLPEVTPVVVNYRDLLYAESAAEYRRAESALREAMAALRTAEAPRTADRLAAPRTEPVSLRRGDDSPFADELYSFGWDYGVYFSEWSGGCPQPDNSALRRFTLLEQQWRETDSSEDRADLEPRMRAALDQYRVARLKPIADCLVGMAEAGMPPPLPSPRR